MLEPAIGVTIMLGLFAVLLGGMIVVTRGDETDVEPADEAPDTTRLLPPVRTLVGTQVPLPRADASLNTELVASAAKESSWTC